MNKNWGWLQSGFLLGLVFLIAVIVVKPIGVSTQYVIADAALLKMVDKELVNKTVIGDKKTYSSSNAYLNKSNGKYAKAADNPFTTYGFIFVLAMVLGGFISSKLSKNKLDDQEKSIPKVWRNSMGDSVNKRRIFSFLGGVLILFGARLAGGCTSGHMMSGMMQTSISGYIFAAAVFLMAIPVSLIMYKKVGETK